MALINKIRQRSGLAIVFISVAILAFILADLLGSSSLFGGGAQMVGEIAGESVSLEEYDGEVQKLRDRFQLQNGVAPDEAQLQSIREQAWNTLIFNKVNTKEYEALGIQVTPEELYQMVQGDSLFIHPQVRQQFTNQETGIFDDALLKQFLQNLSEMPPEQRFLWKSFEEFLAEDRLRTKYNNLFTVSTYVTKAEAKREYENQNTKAEAEYLYIPFTSIVDSTIQVTDQELEEYYEANKGKYEDRLLATSSLEYVVFDILPSPEDSTVFADEIRELSKNLAKAENDSTFVGTYSELKSVPYDYVLPDKLPIEFFQKNPTLIKGGVYGPFVTGQNYKIFKVSDVREDTNYVARASHILISPASSSDEDKAEARSKAEGVLQEIKEGASFEEMARKYNTDATKEKGGDLGFFPKQQMVPAFGEAVFAADEVTLLPNVVETNFGFHIVKVTHPKTNKAYKLAVVEKILDPSTTTRDEAYRQAAELQSVSEDYESFVENVAQNPKLEIQTAERIAATTNQINDLTEAREIIRWAFNEAEIDDVSPVFELPEQNRYVISVLKSKTDKDEFNIENLRIELTQEVLKRKKGEQILAKLGEVGDDFEKVKEKYGTEAQVQTASELALASTSFGSTGYNPVVVGKAFGLAEGKQTQPFADETGVFVVRLKKLTPAAEIADYSQYENQVKQNLVGRNSYLTNEALKKKADIVDERYKFY